MTLSTHPTPREAGRIMGDWKDGFAATSHTGMGFKLRDSRAEKSKDEFPSLTNLVSSDHLIGFGSEQRKKRRVGTSTDTDQKNASPFDEWETRKGRESTRKLNRMNATVERFMMYSESAKGGKQRRVH